MLAVSVFCMTKHSDCLKIHYNGTFVAVKLRRLSRLCHYLFQYVFFKLLFRHLILFPRRYEITGTKII